MSKDITWVGIDAHKKTLQIAVFDGRSVVSEWEIAHELKGIQRLARKLVRLAAGGEVRCCYVSRIGLWDRSGIGEADRAEIGQADPVGIGQTDRGLLD